MKTFLWYVSPTSRVIAQGEHQQAAFVTLGAPERAQVTQAEFCIEVDPTKNQHKASYRELYAMAQAQRKVDEPRITPHSAPTPD